MKPYETPGPTREEIDAFEGPLLLDFGANWCGHCRAAAPAIAEALNKSPDVHHIKIEDGPGRPLGRSFRVKLWPTVIAMRNGKEVARSVRPEAAADVQNILQQLA